jgi:hypothetical protein
MYKPCTNHESDAAESGLFGLKKKYLNTIFYSLQRRLGFRFVFCKTEWFVYHVNHSGYS